MVIILKFFLQFIKIERKLFLIMHIRKIIEVIFKFEKAR